MDLLLRTWNLELAAGNSLGGVVLFGLGVFGTMLAARAVQALLNGRVRRWVARTDTTLDDALLDAFDRPLNLLLLAIGVRWSSHALHLPPTLRELVGNVLTVVTTMFLAWGVTRGVDALRKVLIDPRVAASASKLDDQLVPMADKAVKAVIWSMALLIAFSNLGYDILSLLTGLGIGGLAVAMAAQATLSNLLGSVTIFADQPFGVDDLITVGEHTGVVTEVGLRAVRIRTFEGFVVTIPNATVVNHALVNRTIGGRWRHQATLGLVYGTTSEQLELAIRVLREVFDAHPRIEPDHVVRFLAFGDSSLQLTYAFHAQAGPAGAWLDVISEVNLAIKRRFDEAGLQMAFPTMSVHLERS